MNNSHKRWVMGGLVAIAVFITVLWSWNTLAALFGLPDAQAKHVLAALILLGTLRFAVAHRGHPHRGHRHGRTRDRHEHPFA